MVTGGSTVAATAVVVPVPDPPVPVRRNDAGSIKTNEFPPEVNRKPENIKLIINEILYERICSHEQEMYDKLPLEDLEMLSRLRIAHCID